jgi:hypothetical protein
MNYVPDVPSTALGPNEYNVGLNVECDVRGIRSVAGDQQILNNVPGTPTYISGGFRLGGQFWYIVATTEGYWYASNGTIDWYNITPGGGPILGYNQATNITEAWNGTIPFYNDTVGAPMFLPDTENAILVQYSNLILPSGIDDIVYVNPTTMQIQLSTTYDTPPYIAGQQIVITDVNNFFNGTFTVVSSTTTTINYLAVPGASYPGGNVGTVSPAYTWNYNPNWSSVVANFMRLYSTPNVGSILVAGNLIATNIDSLGGDTNIYPVTIQWSQAFGLNQAPTTWTPTVTNVANQLEVPLRGPALDAFPSNGQFFLCSYWDTVVFSPLNYSTTSAPILGVRLYNQGRGLLSSNCWGNTDKLVYGVDARDIWVFDGNDFTGIGNQQVKNWFFDQLSPNYYDRVFMQINTQKNQVEIYYPDQSAINGVPNKMLSFRYDLQVWNPPREVSNATMACESPIYFNNKFNLGTRCVTYARGVTNAKIIQKDQGFSWYDGSPINSTFRRDNIKLLKDYSGKLMVHRLLPEAVNMGANPTAGSHNELPITPSPGSINIKVEGTDSVGSSPIDTTRFTMNLDTNNPWVQITQNSHRVNTIEINNSSNTNIWMCSATTWQYTQVEDDR